MIRWILRDLRGQLKWCVLFVLNLSFGLFGFNLLTSFQYSIQNALEENSKNFLSADLAISARRIITAEELQIIKDNLPKGSEISQIREIFSMAKGSSGQSRLVQIKGVEESYPYYGQITLDDNVIHQSDTKKSFIEKPVAWVYPELLTQLGIKKGELIKLGTQEFTIQEIVIEDSSQTFRLASIAPKIYLGINWLAKTGLVQFGSTMTDAYLIKFSQIENVGELKNKLLKVLTDSAIKVETPEDASQDTGRVIGYLSDYLGLVALVALCLSAIGIGFLFRNFLFQKIQSVAVLSALGMQRRKYQIILILELSILGLISSLLSFFISSSAVPYLADSLREFTPFQVDIGVSLASLWFSILIGVGACVFIGLPFIFSLEKISVSQLFSENYNQELNMSIKQMLFWLPSLLLFLVVCILHAKSYKIGGLFFIGCLGALIIIGLIGYLFICLLKSLPISRFWIFKHASLTLQRKPETTLAAIICLGIGFLMLNIMPQLRTGLAREMENPTSTTLPSLFVFDIQDDQLSGLKEVSQNAGIELEDVSPLIRARIISVNDKPFEKTIEKSEFQTREEEAEARFRNRGFNLSYREKLSDSEKIVDGLDFYKQEDDSIPQISLEKRFAERLGLKLDDVLKFDIQGVEIEGKVINFREVKWNTFRPNFFVLFQPGTIDDAPKTFLASIKKIDNETKLNIQNQIVDKFPNISLIDVSRLVQRILTLADKMGWALQIMAILSVLSGVVVISTMISDLIYRRRWDLNILKIHGAGPKDLLSLLICEFGMIVLTSGIVGTFLSILISYVLAYFLFDGKFEANWSWAFINFVILSLVVMGYVLFTSNRISKQKPSSLMQSSRL